MRDTQDALDVVVIGAGFSGIGAGIKLLQAGIRNFRIYEKSAGIGGTWWENTYPGAACDVPSQLYSFSFEPNPDWSRAYSPQPEIQAYIERCVERYGLRPHLHNGFELTALRFDDRSGLWESVFANGNRVHSKHVINGSGGLHVPKLPAIPGVESFAGTAMHSARWQADFEPRGKRIAIIGSAASAIQILPVIAPGAAHVELFQRTPNYIAPRNDRAFTEREKARFRRWPWLQKLHRLGVFMRLELLLYPITREKSALRRQASGRVLAHMRSQVRDPALHAVLTPDYQMGCKRILISDDFYPALNRENVDLVSTPISAIEAAGVRTVDGALHPVDAIVYATGFDLEAHMRGFEISGPNGRSLARQWADIPEAYNGCCVAGMPNLWFTTGPNTGVGTTSVVFMIEQELRYIIECIRKAGSDGLIAVSDDASKRYNREIQDALQHTVWASGCHSWYRREDGRISSLYPWNALRFHRQLARVDFNDMVLSTRKNIYA